MMHRFLPTFLAALFMLAAPAALQAMDLEVRDLQRTLFALGYDVGLPDGVEGAETRGAIEKFVAEHPGTKNTDRAKLLSALAAALAVKRKEIMEKSRAVEFYVTPKLDLANVFAAPERNSVITGECGAFREIDMASVATIESFSSRCQNLIGYSKSHHALVELWNDGVTLSSPDTISVSQDLIALPSGKQIFGGKSVVFDGGDRAAVTTLDKSVIMLDLQAPYERRIVGKFRYFARSFAAAENAPVFAVNSSQYENSRTSVESIIFDGDGRPILKSNMWVLAVSNDGRLAAMAEDDGDKVLIRDLPSGKTKGEWEAADVAKMGGSLLSLSVSTIGTVRFLNDGSLVAVVGESDKPMRLKFWRDGKESEVKLPLEGNNPCQILPEFGLVLTLANGVPIGFDLRTGKERQRSKSLPFIEPTASAVNKAGDELAVAHDGNQKQEIYLFDLATGGIKSVVDLEAVGGGALANATIRGLLYAGDDLAVVQGNGAVSLVGRDGTYNGKLQLATDYLTGFDGIAFAASSDGSKVAVAYDGSDDHPRVDVISLPSLKLLRSIRYTDEHPPQAVAFVDGDRRVLVDGYAMRVFDISSGKRVLQKDLRAFVDKRTYYKGWVNYVLPLPDGATYLVGSGSMGGHAMYRYRDGRIIGQLGRKRPRDSWLPASSSKAAMLDDGRFVVRAFGNSAQLVTGSFGAEKTSTTHGPLENDLLDIHALPGQRFLVVDKGGQISFFDARIGPGGAVRQRPYATIHAFMNGNWLARTPQGFFAGTDGAASALNIRSQRNKLYPVDSVYQILYRPDLVAEVLAGDPDGKHAAAAKEINLESILATGAPPELVMTIKEAKFGSADGKASVAADLKDAGGGIGRVEWRVNGLTRAVEDVSKDAAGNTLHLEKSVVLDAETNQIEVVGYNEANKVASRPATGSVTWTQFAENQKPSLYIVSVGVNDYYDSRLHLNYARNDAEAIGKGFSEAGRGLFETVRTMTLLDGDVTRQKLQSAFANLTQSIRSFDVFVLFVAGHGITQDGRYYYIPQNFRYQNAQSVAAQGIKQEDWQSWLAKLPAKKSLLLFDTCESGTLTGDMAARGGLDRLAAIDRLTHATGRSVLSAATDTGPALEGYKGHGVFAYTLLEALATADDNGNGTLEVTEIASHVDANVPKISTAAFGFRQIPQMRLVGANFAVATVSPGALPVSADAPISRKPTHVAAKTLRLLTEAQSNAGAAGEIPAGQLVRVISQSGGFSRIARDGHIVGFVRSDGLLMIQ